MITVDLQTWASAASVVAVGLAALGMLSRKIDGVSTRLDGAQGELKADIGGLRTELKADIGGLRTELKADIGTVVERLDDTRTELRHEIGELQTELKGDIAGLRSEMKTEFGRVESRLNGLEQRTFELSTRLPPLPTRAE